MSMTTLVLALVLAWQHPIPKAVDAFPSTYFTQTHAWRVSKQALTVWPGPTGLVKEWQSGDLNQRQRVALLLGGAAFHNRQLLPVYMEAIRDPSQRIRKAAAYGFRTLIGDLPPPVSSPITDEQAEALHGEMAAVYATLCRHTLVTMWLASALHSEGKIWPGWSGVLLHRRPIYCFQAIEKVVEAEDLDDLLVAFAMFESDQHRTSMAQLIEGLSLNKFFKKPQIGRGWGPSLYTEAVSNVAAWADQSCGQSWEQRLATSIEAIGIHGVDPLHPDACDMWQQILLRGEPSWWLLASRQLYLCGAPATEISILRAEGEESKQQREMLIKFYGLRDSADTNRKRSGQQKRQGQQRQLGNPELGGADG
jgi:hypothetical protein